MPKIVMIWFLLITTLVLSWCVSQSEYDDLSYELEDTQDQLEELQSTIDDCNDNINNAKNYEWASYEEMEYALNSLTECDY